MADVLAVRDAYRTQRWEMVVQECAANPQLRTDETRTLAERALTCGGFAVMTGRVEEGTFSAQLLAEGKMEMIRYPVHLNHPQYEALKRANRFSQTVAYHSPQFTCVPVMLI